MTQTTQIKRAFWLIMLALLTLFLVGACTPADSTEPEQITMYIDSETAECVGVAPTSCLLVKFDKEAEWELFYDSIDGFEYEPGFEYELLVTKTEVEDPPADASSIQYALVEVVSQTAVTNSLAGTDWDLISLGGTDVGNGMTLMFSDNTISGSDGCNIINGRYTIESGSLVIDGDSLAITNKACPESDPEMAQRYISALLKSGRFTLENDQLSIATDEGDLLYSLAKPAELSNTRWQLNGLNDGNAITYMEIDKNIIILFDGNQVSGHAGCNRFNGDVTLDGNQLSFGELAATLMLCPDDEVNQRETEFLAALNDVASYTIERQTLTLLNTDGEMVAAFIVSDDTDLGGTDWQWTRFDGSTESDNIDVADPTRYTLTFMDDGTMAFQADCNSGNGRYAIEDNVLIIDLGPITAAECEPDSLDSVFLAKLGEQNTFQLDEQGNLVLTVETGTLIFEPAPQAAAPGNGQSTLLSADAGWRGIGRINISSACTAVLIDIRAGNEAPAYALTNGHCIEWITNGALTNLDVGGDIVFNYFADSQEAQIAVPIAEVAYSTMQGVDVAIVRLDTTLGALAEQEILPYPLADTPLGNEAVRVIGAPTDGVDPAEAFLREEVCQVRGQTDLLEFTWHFFDAYRTDCQDIFGGSSGSPVFAAESNTLHALMNTTVEGDTLCYLGVPCEIGESGVVLNQTSSYATPIHGLANCFDSTGVFTLNATCPLPPVEQLTFTTQSPIGQPPLSWTATLTGTLPYYRYKTGEATSVDCRSVKNYSEPIPFSDAPTIDDNIPADEGFYLLCVLAGSGATVDDAVWQSPDYPTVAIAQIDTTPPEAPLFDVLESAEFYRITLIFQPPELSDYLFKVGAVEETDCADEDDYLPYRRIPIEIERTGTPMRFCVIGFDHADNATEPLIIDLDTQ